MIKSQLSWRQWVKKRENDEFIVDTLKLISSESSGEDIRAPVEVGKHRSRCDVWAQPRGGCGHLGASCETR